MEELGLMRRTEASKDSYDRFVGALRTSLEMFQQENKKAPDAKQIIEMGDKLMYQKAVPRFFGMFTGRDEPVYNISVPDDVAKQVKADHPDATDEMIRRTYVGILLKRLYQNKKPTNE